MRTQGNLGQPRFEPHNSQIQFRTVTVTSAARNKCVRSIQSLYLNIMEPHVFYTSKIGPTSESVVAASRSWSALFCHLVGRCCCFFVNPLKPSGFRCITCYNVQRLCILPTQFLTIPTINSSCFPKQQCPVGLCSRGVMYKLNFSI
jgi:hypothetical protein